MRWALIALSLTLAACTSSQEVCANYGFKPGTDAFANCLMQRDALAMQAAQDSINSMQATTNAWTQRYQSQPRMCAPSGAMLMCY